MGRPAIAPNSVYPHFFNKKQDKMKELEINKMAVPKKERIINQMDIDYYDGLNKSLSEQYILKLEQEIRSWSIINKI